VLAHNGLDGLSGFVGVVERDGADVVVEDVSLDDTVEELAADETEFTVNGSGGTSNVVPALTRVVRKSWVSVLEKSDGNYFMLVGCSGGILRENVPSQWFTQR
jgi:hypothetical protein